ncbi:hypothetical protein B0H19DRAFT_234083 [Mycena capillaripes]|nr:hypothetical protein B0H19DRAFT_234083 [Mycena capillaripes]
MSFTYKLRLGGLYSLETHVRFQPPFKVSVMKLTKNTTGTKLAKEMGRSFTCGEEKEKDPEEPKPQVSPPCAMRPKAGMVRQGAVRVKQRGIHPRNWLFKIRWLALSEKQLFLYPSETKAVKSSVLLSDVAKLEPTEEVSSGLTLQTKDGRQYLLSFESDGDLYGAFHPWIRLKSSPY